MEGTWRWVGSAAYLSTFPELQCLPRESFDTAVLFTRKSVTAWDKEHQVCNSVLCHTHAGVLPDKKARHDVAIMPRTRNHSLIKA
jgi:hypothetical protein